MKILIAAARLAARWSYPLETIHRLLVLADGDAGLVEEWLSESAKDRESR